MRNRIKFLNTYIDNITFDEAIEEIDFLIKENKNSYFVTPNVDNIVNIEKDPYLKEIYQNADLILTDGKPLIWISKLLKTPIKEKISGSDIFPRICELSAKNGYKIFLLGADVGVAEIAANKLTKKYNGLKIVGTYSPPYGFENNEIEINKIINIIKYAKPDILIIGFGSPKQEKFIYKYKDILNVPLSAGLGASIDFEAGKIKRAPKWMQNCGLEWFYRFLKEPKRLFKRYFINDIKILFVILKYFFIIH